MKRLIAFLLILIMCVSLVACGGGNVQQALQGTWVAEWTYQGENISRYYTFKGNKYTTGGKSVLPFGDRLIPQEIDKETGTFEVEENKIHLIPDAGSTPNDLDYTFNESTGTITLWWNNDIQFKKGNIDPNY